MRGNTVSVVATTCVVTLVLCATSWYYSSLPYPSSQLLPFPGVSLIGLSRNLHSGRRTSASRVQTDDRTTSRPSRCRISLVETMPEGLKFNSSAPRHESTYAGWRRLLAHVERDVALASFYWTLLAEDVAPAGQVPADAEAMGRAIFKELVGAGRRDAVDVRVVRSWPAGAEEQSSARETQLLADKGGVHVRTANFSAMLGGGVLHTKLWLIDDRDFYVGSANMDLRALSDVKELGAVGMNCPALAVDLHKIFAVYWMTAAGVNSHVPAHWPSAVHTSVNMTHPLRLTLADGGGTVSVYASSSPRRLCPPGRTVDIDAVRHVIADARRFVCVAVMDYLPLVVFGGGRQRFWPLIDDALRAAAIDARVRVRLLVSKWQHTAPEMLAGLRSLQALDGMRAGGDGPPVSVEVRLFRVPPRPDGLHVPFTRVNHNKYMVTDRVAYIGTSNWSGDYFINTAGVGLVVNTSQTTTTSHSHHSSSSSQLRVATLRDQLEAVFLRDWNSQYAAPLSPH